MKREIIKIDEEKCDGCGQCIPACPEGALQIIDGKARLVSDLFCDGLGACIGDCPQNAITIEKREAQPYDEQRVMENIVEKGKNTVKAHLKHLKEHGEMDLYREAVQFLEQKGMENPLKHSDKESKGKENKNKSENDGGQETSQTKSKPSKLNQWPIQLGLLSALTPFIDDSDLLIAADCVPYAYPDFHSELLGEKTLLVGCPKLDDPESYREKFRNILKENNIHSVTYVRMEVPCCAGMIDPVKEAIDSTGEDIPFQTLKVTTNGELCKRHK